MARRAFSSVVFAGLSLAVPLVEPIGSLHAQSTGDAADSAPVQLADFVVAGRATDLVGSAETASEGSVGYVELEARPFLRRGELLEVVPGVVITQHSGDGKANQYFLRGFNLDHGTDFSLSVDGMPVNMRSHAHGQGYADLNFIIPEFVQSVDYSKGPFTAAIGDFSAAGAASFQLFKTLPEAFAKIEIGEDQYARFVAGDTFMHGGGTTTTVGFEVTHNNGPWDLDENFHRFSGLVRQSWNDGPDREFSLTALGYGAKWNSTDQVPLRAVETGFIDRFGNIDPTDGGDTARASLSFDGLFKGVETITHLTAYAIYYRLNLFSDFTYFLDDPVNGDQFNQRDRRGIFGANLEHDRSVSLFGRKLDTALGMQLRYDTIDLALDHTAERQLVNVIRHDHVNEGSVGLYMKGTVHWTDWLRIEAGLRGDFYSFDVGSDNPLNSGHRTAAIASPKLGLVFGAWGKTEFYANAGLGFHSNDARGTTITVSPTDGTPVAADSPLVRSHGLEAGVRTSAIPGLVTTAAVWALDLDSELVFSGDAGNTEASGATRRYGVEFANYYKVYPWLAFDADVSFTHARYREGAPADYVANSISTVVTGGIVAGKSDGLFGSLRLRYFGPQPIIEDNSVREPSSTTFNARIGWRNRRWEIALDVLNLLNRENNDIAYYYTSRLPGEPAAGVDDTHFHPTEPREFRLSVMRKF